MVKAKSSFLNRIVEAPFEMDPTQSIELKQKGLDSDFVTHRSKI